MKATRDSFTECFFWVSQVRGTFSRSLQGTKAEMSYSNLSHPFRERPYRIIGVSWLDPQLGQNPNAISELQGLVQHVLPFHIPLGNSVNIVVLQLAGNCVQKQRSKTYSVKISDRWIPFSDILVSHHIRLSSLMNSTTHISGGSSNTDRQNEGPVILSGRKHYKVC